MSGGAFGPGGVTALAHVAFATRDADATAATLAAALGAERGAEELLDGGALRIVFVRLGPVTIELLEPRRTDHTVAKFLDQRGPGLHHVSFDVADLSAALARARAAGAHGSRVAFLHPKSLGGVLIELCERAGDRRPL